MTLRCLWLFHCISCCCCGFSYANAIWLRVHDIKWNAAHPHYLNELRTGNWHWFAIARWNSWHLFTKKKILWKEKWMLQQWPDQVKFAKTVCGSFGSASMHYTFLSLSLIFPHSNPFTERHIADTVYSCYNNCQYNDSTTTLLSLALSRENIV